MGDEDVSAWPAFGPHSPLPRVSSHEPQAGPACKSAPLGGSPTPQTHASQPSHPTLRMENSGSPGDQQQKRLERN